MKLSNDTIELNERLELRKNAILNNMIVGDTKIVSGINFVQDSVNIVNPEELTKDSIDEIHRNVNERLEPYTSDYRILDKYFSLGIDCGYQIIDICYNLKQVKVKKR